jgi:hypothetical protein
MPIFAWIFRTLILSLVVKLLGGFFPILRRLLRLIGR